MISVIGLLTAASVLSIYHLRAQNYSLEKVRDFRERTWVLDRNGEQIGHVYGHGVNRRVVELDDVSPHFINALLAREDSRFYQHGGVDYLGVLRAIYRNLKEQRAAQGASTLTMQLARNTFGMREKSLDRKMVEVAIARRIEAKFSKEEILKSYLNRIYFGSGLYGVERAAQGYFMKPASDLTLPEAAMLAGIIRGPSSFSPFRSEELAKAQQREVLARMKQQRMITDAEATTAFTAKLALRPADQRMASPGYVVQEIHEKMEDFLSEKQIIQGGLRVFTTIDRRLQAAAQESMQAHLSEVEARSGFPHPAFEAGIDEERKRESPYVQGAVVALDNATGGILVLVGGRDYDDSPFNRAFDAQRQVGSTYKPFVYAQAFTSGLRPGTLVSDAAISMPGGGGRRWKPSNSDGKFGGPTPAATGLIRSRNTMSIRVGQMGGIEPNIALAQAVGFTAEIPESPVSYLGTFDSSPLQLASAYSVFPNFGAKHEPYLIERIETSAGEVLFERQAVEPEAVLAPSAAWLTAEVLGRVMDEGTGRAARNLDYDAPCYGKTGTTNDYRDAWFAGFTDKVTCGVWVGMDRPKTIMNRGYGSTLALPIWTGVMKAAEETDLAAALLQPPGKLVNVQLCAKCGLLESRRAVSPYAAALPMDFAPTENCSGHLGGIFASKERNGDGDNPIKALGRFLFGKKKKDD